MLEPCGVSPPHPRPRHVGLKRFREFSNGSVPWFGLPFVVVFILPQEESCQYHVQPKHGKGFKPVHLGRLNGGSFSLSHCERKSHTVPVDFQGLCLWCLSNGSSHFY